MSLKLLLIEDVDSLGRSGDLVEVRPGYARNFLIPQGLAKHANKEVLRLQAKLQEERQKKALEDKKDAEAIKAKLEGLELSVAVKVDPEGHMYGSVSVQDILDLILKASQVELDKKAVQLAHPIKKTGTHHITLKLKEEVVVENITLKVSSEEDNA
ncbi:MAG: 50S ribosomal protein L9 [Chlamydiia bacterium]|nr:50S ribosomal protein L9 [Chlamydiia bacterium]